MDTQIAASPEAMLKLAEDTGELLKKIVRYNSELSAKLDNLGSTFQDEGFDIIKEHIQKTRNRISESLPEFRVLLGKLTEVANLYEGSRQAIEEKESLNWAGKVLAVPVMAIGIGAAAGSVPDPIVRPVNNNLTPTPEIVMPKQDVKEPSAVPINTVTEKKPVANNLSKTQQEWVYHQDGSKTFNTPEETGKTLNYDQGKAVKGFKGTCGIVSSANILTMAGIKASEEDLIEYCSKNINKDIFSGGFGQPLCEINGEFADNGGTNSIDRQQILAHYGVDSVRQEQTVDNIAAAVEAGKGVIISVETKELWQSKQEGLHAIIVTSVKRDKDDNIVGFWVTDSGAAAREPATYYSKDIISNALIDSRMNVTTNIIR